MAFTPSHLSNKENIIFDDNNNDSIDFFEFFNDLSYSENMCSSKKKKKKKKPETETWVAVKEAWVALRPGSHAAWLCLWVSTWYFSHHSYILRDWTINKHLQKAVVQKLYTISELINRVSKTRFPNSRHMEKMPHQAWSDHGKTRFIDPKSSLLDSRC